MELTLKDGKKIEVDKGITGLDAAKSISTSLAQKCLAVKLNGELIDYRESLTDGGEFEVITRDSPEALRVLNHTCAHVLAQAILHIYPEAQIAFGPAVDEGFYYDIEFKNPISEKDFPAIEKEMHKIVDAGYPIERKDVTHEEAKNIFKNQHFKLEHIDELNGPLTIYTQGDFTDLCKGPHVKSVSLCKAFKLTSIAGAYFHGDKNNEQLTRIYGTCFFSQNDLNEYLKLVEERKKADHRLLGKQLNLFMLSEYGPGFPFWLNDGLILRRELENYWIKLHIKNGYQIIDTPIILSRELWEISGHWGHYNGNMYTTKIDDKDFAIKPMNCPGGILVYKNQPHSYKEFPIRIGELGHVHRHEASGALNGLFRVRSFTQDDAHCFVRGDQIQSEIEILLKIFDEVYKTFNLPYYIVLSTRPEEGYIGEIATWDKAESILRKCLEQNNIPYQINPGDGAFYGPKLDFKLHDSLGRVWQCGTIQLDMNLPRRFHCEYVDANGQKVEPFMLHRAIFGSLERFTGILIEHFKGAFPTWLSPKQVVIIPVNNTAHLSYSQKINEIISNSDIRCQIDDRDEKLGYKIHDWQTKKVPYTLVIGDNEVNDNTITYRIYGKREQITVPIDSFVEMVHKDIDSKQIER
ncbi:MAG: threonine--tRNA ligase [Bacilli bacterium]|nr:threonine--tRNA ligase [Bacilli bacterium]